MQGQVEPKEAYMKANDKQGFAHMLRNRNLEWRSPRSRRRSRRRRLPQRHPQSRSLRGKSKIGAR